jgi:hypothetical protein
VDGPYDVPGKGPKVIWMGTAREAYHYGEIPLRCVRMKYLIAVVLLAGVAAAQDPIKATAPAKSAAAAAGHAGATASGGSAKAGAAASDPLKMSADDGSVSITEKPITKKEHAEVPASLLGGSSDPAVAAKMAENNTAAPDETEGVATAAHSKPKPAAMKVMPKGQLHFEDLEPGSDPVSITVRSLEMFANDHPNAETEVKVREWVKNNANVMATSPAELRRKQQYQPTVDRLTAVGFPKAWFETAAPAQ